MSLLAWNRLTIVSPCPTSLWLPILLVLVSRQERVNLLMLPGQAQSEENQGQTA